MDTDDKRDSGERKVQIFPFYIHEDLRLAAPQLNTTLLINVHQNAGLKEDLRASGVVWFQIYNWYLYTKRKIWPVSHLHSPHLWCSEILNKFLEHTAPIIRSCSVKKKKAQANCALSPPVNITSAALLYLPLSTSQHTHSQTQRGKQESISRNWPEAWHSYRSWNQQLTTHTWWRWGQKRDLETTLYNNYWVWTVCWDTRGAWSWRPEGH